MFSNKILEEIKTSPNHLYEDDNINIVCKSNVLKCRNLNIFKTILSRCVVLPDGAFFIVYTNLQKCGTYFNNVNLSIN